MTISLGPVDTAILGITDVRRLYSGALLSLPTQLPPGFGQASSYLTARGLAHSIHRHDDYQIYTKEEGKRKKY
jgi:hypothetical protein